VKFTLQSTLQPLLVALLPLLRQVCDEPPLHSCVTFTYELPVAFAACASASAAAASCRSVTSQPVVLATTAQLCWFTDKFPVAYAASASAAAAAAGL
jgi:hypothetical protein